jgi:hypothetical protein
VAQPVALAKIAAALGQQLELRLLLDALGNHRDAQRVGHGDDRRGQRQVVRITLHVGNETLVDLHAVHGHLAQVAQAREAGAEVVQPHLDAGAMQLVQQLRGHHLITDHGGLGQFQMQARSRQPRLMQALCDQ